MTRAGEAGSVVTVLTEENEMRRDTVVTALGLMLLCAVAPLGAQGKKQTATMCKDGTTSAVAGRGACSGHGGVDSAATKAAKTAKKAAKAEVKEEQAKASKNPERAAAATAAAQKAEKKATKAGERAANDSVGATAQCKDGTYSHAAKMQGACSRHGGVQRTIKR
jgi:hypothetical protein